MKLHTLLWESFDEDASSLSLRFVSVHTFVDFSRLDSVVISHVYRCCTNLNQIWNLNQIYAHFQLCLCDCLELVH